MYGKDSSNVGAVRSCKSVSNHLAGGSFRSTLSSWPHVVPGDTDGLQAEMMEGRYQRDLSENSWRKEKPVQANNVINLIEALTTYGTITC